MEYKKYTEIFMHIKCHAYHQAMTPVSCLLPASQPRPASTPNTPPLLLDVVLPPRQRLQEILLLLPIGPALHVFRLYGAQAQGRGRRGVGYGGVLVLEEVVRWRLAALGVAWGRPKEGSGDAVIPVWERAAISNTKHLRIFSL